MFIVFGRCYPPVTFTFLAAELRFSILQHRFSARLIFTNAHALSNTQSSYGPRTLWPSVHSLTAFPQDWMLHPHTNIKCHFMLCWLWFIIIATLNYWNQVSYVKHITKLDAKSWELQIWKDLGFTDLGIEVSYWPLLSHWLAGHWG